MRLIIKHIAFGKAVVLIYGGSKYKNVIWNEEHYIPYIVYTDGGSEKNNANTLNGCIARDIEQLGVPEEKEHQKKYHPLDRDQNKTSKIVNLITQ
ncbi:MAG: hypothetical protein LBS03_09990 [Bacteroidales bacterium]|jgi:hypothetical protein|nr:hypothetical protein [Bacteroidales bacterium]